MKTRLTQALIAITMLALAHPASARTPHGDKAMTADEMISRLVDADERNVEITVKLKSGGEVKGYVGYISRQYFTIWANSPTDTRIEYTDVYSIKSESPFKVAMRRVGVTALVVIAAPVMLPTVLIIEGLYFLFTGESPPSC